MKLFCRHKYEKTEKKYYKTGYTNGLWFPTTYVYVYRGYKYKKCGKEVERMVLRKEFTGWNANRFYQEFLQKTVIISN